MALYQGIIGGGSSPVEPEDLSPVLLWTNPSTTSEFSPQKIDLDLTNYVGVIVEYKYTYNVDFMCTRTFVKKDDVMTYSVDANTVEYGSGCSYVTSNGTWSARSRTITSIDNTGITFGKGGFANSVDNGHFIPTKIYGVKEYVVEPVSGIQFSEFATMGANTDIDAVIGDYYILESRDTYTTSASSSTTITGADKIIEKLDTLTTQKVAIYTTVIKATSDKFRCDKAGYYSHITLN